MKIEYDIGTDWSTIAYSRKRDMKKTPQTVGRPREFSENDVLDSVMALFWKHGFEGTGLSDILTATGLAKGSIYKAFKSKHNLYLLSLARYEAVHVDSAVKALGAKGTPLEKLDSFLSAPIKDMATTGLSKGCFLCNASADRAQADSETRALVQRGFNKLAGALTGVITELNPQMKPKAARQSAQMMLTIYSGLRTMSRSGIDPAELYLAKDAAFKSLL